MFEWVSDHRASIALILIIGLVIAFVSSIHIGIKQTRLRAKDQVFGDPDRTKGGWFWALLICQSPGTCWRLVLLWLV